MAVRYYATHPPMLGDIVWQALKAQLKDAKVQRKFDNGLEFTSNKPAWQLKEIPFLQNIFVIAESFDKNLNIKSLTAVVNKSETLSHIIKKHTTINDTFRIVMAKGPHTNQLPEGFRIAIEENVKRYTKRGLSRTLPKFEIWLWQVVEDYTILALRVTQNADYQKYMPKGGLRQELAYLMNFMTKPKDSDIVWDPFAGSGSLVVSRSLHFTYKQLIATDISTAKIEGFLSKQKLKAKNLHIQEVDFFARKYLPTVDCIITDPPWSIFADKAKTKALIKIIVSCLKQDGQALILSAISLEEYASETTVVTSRQTFVGGREAYINLISLKS